VAGRAGRPLAVGGRGGPCRAAAGSGRAWRCVPGGRWQWADSTHPTRRDPLLLTGAKGLLLSLTPKLMQHPRPALTLPTR
jgi:hypothetical protein